MAAANPFDVPIDAQTPRFSTPDDEFDPILRSPALRAVQDPDQRDLEREKLDMEDTEIVQLLNGYFDEAENARETGFEPRHMVWEQNLHAFWMRKDFPDKMPWQAQEKSAYIPSFAERFAATHREALTQNPDWAQVTDRYDETGVLSKFGTKLTRIALDFAGTNTSGQAVAFEHDFGNMVLTGALMKMVVAIQYDPKAGRVVTELVDPRQCYWDPTGRNLYRVRFWEVDKETLLRQADLVDEEGEPLYDKEAIESVVASHDMRVVKNQQDSSGQGQMLSSHRTPILIKEWLVDLIDRKDGASESRIVRERQLVVTANDHTIIRGPEKNPWWHGKDWIVSHPVLQAPLKAVDGRTYVELFRQAVETHENVTNRILDAVSTTSMNAFEVNPDLLDDPTTLEHGIAPNQTIFRDADAPPGEKAITPIQMGNTLSADIMRVWDATRREAQEAGAQSDLSLGQTARGETTATEVVESKAGQSALNSSISIDIDLGFLSPVAELVYYTAIQKVDETSKCIWPALSPEDQAMLRSRREEFRARPVHVRARGLTAAVRRSKRLRGLLGALNVLGSNPMLIQEFQKNYSVGKLVNVVLEDFGVETDAIKLSEQEKFARDDAMRQAKAQQDAATAMAAMTPGGGGAPSGAPGGPQPAAGATSQGTTDPGAPGVAEGLPGEVR